MSRVKIIVHTPAESADEIRKVLGEAGAGVIGNYTYCSFSVKGTGRFTAQDGANPVIGQIGEPESVTEESIEVICDRAEAKNIVAAVRAAHPYEEPAYEIIPLLDEDDL